MNGAPHSLHATCCEPAAHAGLVALAATLDELMDSVVAVLQAAQDVHHFPEARASAMHGLAQASAALDLGGEHGLAALVARFRALIPACEAAAVPASRSLAELASGVRTLLRVALDRVLRDRPLAAADLLLAWQMLSPADGAPMDPALLLSLRHDDALLILPPADEVPAGLVAESERALLEFLRASDPDARRAPALILAKALCAVSSAGTGAAECACWLVLHAYLLELAEGNADPERAKKNLSVLVRVLRHRDDAGGRDALASLARQALFELAQFRPVTETACRVVQAFHLEQQLAPSGAGLDESLKDAVSAADQQFIRLLGQWLLARDAASDDLGPAAAWQEMAACAAQSDRCAPLATSLQLIEARLPALAAGGASLRVAAAMLCVHDWARSSARPLPHGREIDALLARAADLQEAVAQPALDALIRSRDAQPLIQQLSAACREALGCSERQLEAAAGQGALVPALADADGLLAAIAGALRMLCIPDLPERVDDLRAMLRTLQADGPQEGTIELFARAWATLSDQVALLPWAAGHQIRPETEALPDHAQQAAAPESLSTVFQREAGHLLEQLRSAVLARDGTQPACDPAAALHAAHTLAGCSSTVGLRAMNRLALALESALERNAEAGHGPADAGLLAETLDCLGQMLAQFAVSGTCSDAQDLLDRLSAAGSPLVSADMPFSPAPPSFAMHSASTGGEEAQVADNEPLPQDACNALPEAPTAPVPSAGSAQEELIATFSEEAADLLPRLDQALQHWRDSPGDRTGAQSMLRLLHTLKGSARMAGQLALGDELHRCEAEIGAITQLPLPVSEEQLDRLQACIDAWRHGWPYCAEPDSVPAVALAAVESVPAPAASGAPLLPAVPAGPLPAGEAAPRAMLRIRAELIDRFADAAAGLWLGHTRIADGVRQQRRTVSDLADNLVRLRSQLRELEIDTESRILSGAAPAALAGFDPLELDHYTRLHEITRMIAESVADLTDLQRGLQRQLEGMSQSGDAHARELRRLQSEVQAVRSQPFSTIEPRLRHMLRQAAREAGREAVLVVEGGATQVERSLLDRLCGPLEHLLRNALVHGIEPPDQRESIGKPRAGKIALTVRPSATELQLELADDGRGLDYDRIRARAAAAGLLPADVDVDLRQLADLIFSPGLSTSSEVTALSGRGIGLDAVSAELQLLGGRVGVRSSPGQGCCFSLGVPLSLATLPVVLVAAGRHRIALSASRLQQLLQLRPEQLLRDADGLKVRWQDQVLPLIQFSQLLGEPAPVPAPGASLTVAILHDAGRWLALQVDAVDGQRELVVRNPGPQLSRVPGLVGASLLGDGGIALIIDPFRLRLAAPGQPTVPTVPTEADARPLVMVVDDSLTVRRASQRVLERHGFAVTLARDGVEALELLRDVLPSAMLLDIEMPRMDGFELLSVLRDDARLRTIPVVMITSRIANRHRDRAFQLGASAYLGKPFQEEELIRLLSGLCAAQRAAA